MSYTLDENGRALTETRDGVTMPIDCSFEMVNDWIHGVDVQYEEVEALCLGMAVENDRLRAKLKSHALLPVGTDQAEIIDCSEHEIAYARISDKYKTTQRGLNSAKALIADIQEFDVESFLILPHELRKRMQAILDS